MAIPSFEYPDSIPNTRRHFLALPDTLIQPVKKLQPTPSDLVIGDIWYVELPGQGPALTRVVIEEITKHVIGFFDDQCGKSSPRYRMSDIDFVERL